MEARRSRPNSTEDGEFGREIQRGAAADNAVNDLDVRIQAELSQVPVSGTSKADKPRPSMTLDQLEEVMPWELYPPPPSPVVHAALPGIPTTVGGASENGVASGKRRAPTTETYGPGHKSFADFGLRRRRSTGASGATSASPSGYTGGGGGGPSTTRRESRLKDREDRERGDRIRTSTSTGFGVTNNATSSLATSPTSPLGSTISNAVASSSQLASPPPVSQSNSLSTTPQPPKFSTVDRTILEQLKANLQAREAQFTLKGVGHTIVGGGRSPGKKHHPYSKEVVPYPRSYGREVVDLDVWETMFALDICESLTWHVFETPPTKVLELGCGTGTWILRCAETWKDCHFVGLDIVPLHPDLQNVGSESASRITWLQHNFLEGLPFQNEEFDFVHIKRIALGVPENKWDKLFEDIVRVMKPGGAFEMVEEDLFFPGKLADDGDDVIFSTRHDDASSMNRRDSMSSDNHDLKGHEDMRSETPTTITHQTLLDTTGPPHVIRRENGGLNDLREEEEHRPLAKPSANSSQPPHSLVPTHPVPPSIPGQGAVFIPPHSRSTSRPALSVKTQRNGDPYSNFIGFAAHPSMFGSSVSLLGSMGYIALNDPFTDMVKKVQHQQQQRERAGSQTSAAASASPKKTKTSSSPFTLQGLTNSPTNPRDHTILEAIWNGMLESRFVNLTPLSILTTNLEYHFKDVRTHPPLLYTFPPVPIKPEPEEDDEGVDGDQNLLPSDSEPDTDDARDAVVPRPKRPRSTKSKKSSGSNSSAPAPFSDENGEFSENHRWLSMQALLRNQSPYVTLDESRTFGYSPARKATFPVKVVKDGSKPSVRRASRLPNTTLNIDLRTLNLHLALRAKEVIACSESMWEWVLEYQANATSALAQRDSRNRSGSMGGYMVGVDGSASSSSLDLTRNVILEMTRDDFDLLLNNFEMDMQDKASVGNALRERFDWHVFSSPILQDRKAFDNACEKYDDWVAAQKAKLPSSPYRHSNTHHPRNSMSAPGLVLPTLEPSIAHDPNQISRSTSSPQPSTSYHLDDTSSPTMTEVPSLTRSHHHHDSGSTVHFAAALSSPSTASQMSHSMPTQKLSRAMRVFVAWKAL
ncbi:hypothetical protein M413DRAFT_154519 [Hebeloma cylindrosporum]|uniref:Methyltransferase domain-containing protein n=1 Tax=Hebeloma cylindrosporum TaxID=76867 RepID=A0A0C3CB57_HEBCY|nr:hypothetical protein M413DRAFT_154519 [Hebeloma cylindrosporum h7]